MPQRSRTPSPDSSFLDLVHAIVVGDATKAAQLADNSPALVHARAAVGATRKAAESHFFEAIAHYMYEGDTALHMAAAGFKPAITQALIDRGAECSAKNRRGAEPRGRNNSGSTPLHLAVQNTGRGGSGTPHAIEQQKQIIELLLRAGARPDDKDANGKAVRDAVTAEWIRALF